MDANKTFQMIEKAFSDKRPVNGNGWNDNAPRGIRWIGGTALHSHGDGRMGGDQAELLRSDFGRLWLAGYGGSLAYCA